MLLSDMHGRVIITLLFSTDKNLPGDSLACEHTINRCAIPTTDGGAISQSIIFFLLWAFHKLPSTVMEWGGGGVQAGITIIFGCEWRHSIGIQEYATKGLKMVQKRLDFVIVHVVAGRGGLFIQSGETWIFKNSIYALCNL